MTHVRHFKATQRLARRAQLARAGAQALRRTSHLLWRDPCGGADLERFRKQVKNALAEREREGAVTLAFGGF